jgi:hypothetical protein
VACVVACVVAAATLVATGMPARADDDAPVFTAAGTVPEHPEILRAAFADSPQVVSVVAALTNPADGTVLAVNLELDDDAHEWRSQPLVMPLGEYRAVFTAKDDDGDTKARWAEVDYRFRPVVLDVQTSTTPLDFDHRVATATGRIALYDPRTQAYRTEATGRVQLSLLRDSSLKGSGSADVEPDGSFAVEALPLNYLDGPLTAYLTVVPDDAVSSILRDGSFTFGRVTIAATASRSRFVMDASAVTDNYPRAVTLSGTLQRQVSGAWVPAAGVDVQMAANSVAYGAAHLAVTDAAGRFAFRGSWLASETVQVTITGSARAFLHDSPTPTNAFVGVTFRPVTRLTWYKPAVDGWKAVRLEGWLAELPSRPWNGKARVYLQRSLDGRSGWKSLGSVVTDRDGWFLGDVVTPRTSGYFRTYFAGTAAHQPRAGRVFTLSRRDSRIIRLTVTRTTVAKGKSVRIKGLVQVYNGTKFVPVRKGQWVEISFRIPGRRMLDPYDAVRTTSSGTFSITVRPWRSGYWSARWYASSSRYVHAISRQAYVRVT